MPEHTLRTAQAVYDGLLPVGHLVRELGCGEGKYDILHARNVGWHVVKVWRAHTKSHMIVFGFSDSHCFG